MAYRFEAMPSVDNVLSPGRPRKVSVTAIAILTMLSFPGGSPVTERYLIGHFPSLALMGVEVIPVEDYYWSAPIDGAGGYLELIPVGCDTGMPGDGSSSARAEAVTTFLLSSPRKGGGWTIIDTLETVLPLHEERFAFWTPGPCQLTLSTHAVGSTWASMTTWEMTDSGFVQVDEIEVDLAPRE
jgi:hypothetical protein